MSTIGTNPDNITRIKNIIRPKSEITLSKLPKQKPKNVNYSSMSQTECFRQTRLSCFQD